MLAIPVYTVHSEKWYLPEYFHLWWWYLQGYNFYLKAPEDEMQTYSVFCFSGLKELTTWFRCCSYLSTTFTLRKKGTKKAPLGVHSLVIVVVPSRIHLVTLVKAPWTVFYFADFCFDLV